jgi:succinoglycan biosynthesis protein ExoM
MSDNVTRIGVAVLTFRRPELLREALLSLQQQTIVSSPATQLNILVVDNDPAKSGEASFLAVQQSSNVPMHYCTEPIAGLASARNRALAELKTMDYIAFLDDDETAAPQWMEELLRAQIMYSADVVCGPVEPRFQQPMPWIDRGKFFVARQMPDGADPQHIGAGNVLFRAALGDTFQFDPAFNHAGGEDTHFFLQLRRAGHTFAWAGRAVAFETIPPERMTAPWLIRRAYSDAHRLTRSLLTIAPGWQTALSRLAAALANAAIGLVTLPLAIFGKHYAVKALRRIARARGTVAAVFNRPHTFYGDTSK